MKLILTLILSFIFTLSLKANDNFIDANAHIKTILGIGHFNGDNSLDTLYGAGSNFAVYPRFIHWGNDINRSTTFTSEQLVEKSKIKYPNFENINIAGFIQKMNSDTLQDLVLFVWGKTDTTSTSQDTIVTYCLFGQGGLDTLNTIDLTVIDSVSTYPFVGMNLYIGETLVDFDIRDFTEYPSFRINKIDPVVPPPPVIRNPTNIPFENNILVKLYPNPATYYTNIELNSFSPGKVSAELYDLDLKLIWNLELNLRKGEKIIEKIDLQNIAIGSYILKITDQNGSTKSFKLIVIK